MRPVLLALALLVIAAAAGALAADPAIAATGAAAAASRFIAAPQADHTDTLPPHEAAKAAAKAAQSRSGALQSSAYPAPHYANYTLASSRDTFEICKNQSGLRREISMEELLPIYGLPRELLQHRRVSMETLVQVLSSVAPSARLVIAPLLAGEAELSPVLHPDGKLPRLIHFTVREKNAMLPHQALSIASWARLNPAYSILLYDDADIADFMSTYHAHLLPLFHRLSSQVERTDLWRYLVLCTFGGVYADSDVVAGRPVSSWVQDAGLLTGVENAFETMAAARRRDYTRVMQIVQWTIAARAGHPVVCRMGEYISRRMDQEASGAVSEEDRDHAILERTGPGIWSSSVHDYLRQHGVVPESMVGGGKVGDVRILPQSTFGCASSTVNLADPIAYVYHMFKGSWRLHEPGKLWQFITHFYAHLFDSPTSSKAAASPAVKQVVVPGSSSSGGGGVSGAKGSAAAVGLAVPSGVRKQEGAAVAVGEQKQQAAAAVATAAAAAKTAAPALADQQQQKQQQQQGVMSSTLKGAGNEEGSTSSSSSTTTTNSQAVERRLHEQVSVASLMQLQPLHAPAQHSPTRNMHVLPMASGLVVVALICSALVQRSSSKCSSASGGRPCGGLRQSASGALTGIWGGAKRLGGRVGSLGCLNSSSMGSTTAALLPLSQQPGKAAAVDRPLAGSASSAALVAAASSVVSATRQQGSSASGCLKRSGGSMQCLHSRGSSNENLHAF